MEQMAISTSSTPDMYEKALLKVEDAFVRLGGYSRFQIFATVVIIFLEVPAAMIAMSPILTGTSNVDFFCMKDDIAKSQPIAKTDWCNSTCSKNGSTAFISAEPRVSIVQEFGLICDKSWITDTLTSVQMVGSMLGPLVTAQIADRYGRKVAFFLICVIMGLSGIICSVSVDVYTYAMARFLAGFAVGGCLVAHMNYLMEFLTPSWRAICGCVNFWPLGEMLLGLTGYLLPAWRHLSWVVSMPAVGLFVTFIVLPESPRWLLCQGKTKEAIKVFDQIANWNGKPKLSPYEIQHLQETIIEETIKSKLNETGKLRLSSVFRSFQIRKQILIFMLAWFANAVTYYGLSFNMKNMSGNPYLNLVLFGVADWPAELSGFYFSNRFGRKVTFITYLLLSSVFLAIVVGIELSVDEASYATLILVLCLFGRFCNEASWAVMSCFTGESFPTVGRSIAFSICSACSSLGGIVAPQMAFLGSIWKPGPYVVFCGLSLIGCLASTMLTEMKGKPLEDTVKTESKS